MMRLKPPPHDPFLVGRLVGAAEMASTLLQGGALTDRDLHELGRKLGQAAAPFLDKQDITRPLELEPGPATSG
jgi:hypothetical protein